MTISAMRNDMNFRQEKKYRNNSHPKKTRFATQKNTTHIKNKHPKSKVRDTNTKIQHVRNQSPKAIPKSKNISTHMTQTPNKTLHIRYRVQY